MTNGYFRAPDMTAERFDDGWFNTGDYVRVKDGYLEILDRVTDIIIVGGFNVYPQEVELALREHPAIQTVIVIGMPHAVNGEVPKAYIQKTEGAQISELEIVKYCKERLAHFKVPRKIEFVDDFPLSSAGKILRRVLRDRGAVRGVLGHLDRAGEGWQPPGVEDDAEADEADGERDISRDGAEDARHGGQGAG